MIRRVLRDGAVRLDVTDALSARAGYGRAARIRTMCLGLTESATAAAAQHLRPKSGIPVS